MRLFLALPLPSQIEKELTQIQNQLKEKRGKVKWVRPEHIHLTVRFYGETDEKLVGPLREKINSIAASVGTSCSAPRSPLPARSSSSDATVAGCGALN